MFLAVETDFHLVCDGGDEGVGEEMDVEGEFEERHHGVVGAGGGEVEHLVQEELDVGWDDELDFGGGLGEEDVVG